jgi:hypothetical protein
MPEQIQKYKIFIASPSDLTPERELISSVISELNRTYGNPNNIVIELVRWETNSAPGISNVGVQSIINNDIPQYDIFIGLLWTRFGTPTKCFDSGTEEEFHIAHKKFQNDNNSVQILFYFKTTPTKSINDIDANQLSKVREFKVSLETKKILYWEFNDNENLGSFLRQHIPMRIDTLRNKITASAIEQSILITTKVEIDEDEFGIIDYQELMNDSLNKSMLVLENITKSTDWVCLEIEKRVKELGVLANKAKIQNVGTEILRITYKKTADVLNTYASKIDPEIPVYFKYFQIGINSYSKLAAIYVDDFKDMQDKLSETNKELEDLLEKSLFTIDQLKGFLISIESIQRVSKEINSAKKNLASKLNDLIDKLEKGHSIANEAYENVNSKLI